MLTVLIPVYNEEDSIVKTIDEIGRALRGSFIGEKFEIIVINDGSTDSSRQVLDGVDDPLVRVLHRPRNRGYGASLKAGLRKAKNDYVAITDADGTYPNAEIPVLFQRCLDNELDMIVGARTGEGVKIPAIRKPMKAFLRGFASHLVQQPIPDLNSGLRVFKREFAMRYYDMYPDGFSFTTTITMAALSHDCDVEFVPITYAHRTGKSKIRPIADSANFLLLVIRMTMYFNPLRVFLPVTVFLFSLFLGLFAYDVFVLVNLTERTLMVGNLTATVFALGLLADAVAKKS
jgi:glycosyltransferase involved in cell wall biosynthesis